MSNNANINMEQITPDHEQFSEFMARCLETPEISAMEDLSQRCAECTRMWEEQPHPVDETASASDTDADAVKNTRLQITYASQPQDIDAETLAKIKNIAPDIDPTKIYLFPKRFQICKSGANFNANFLTPDSVRKSAPDWIGKSILKRDHNETSTSMLGGKIYDVETDTLPDGEVVLYGRGYGVLTSDPDDLNFFDRVSADVLSSMSCRYDVRPDTVTCSKCNEVMGGMTCCPNGHKPGKDCLRIHSELIARNISYVVDPAIENSGHVNNQAQKSLQAICNSVGAKTATQATRKIAELNKLAEDGRNYREAIKAEFMKFAKLSWRDVPVAQLNSMADKMTATEMCMVGGIAKEKFHQLMPTTKQITIAEPEQTRPSPASPEKNLTEIQEIIRNNTKGDKK